MDWKKFIKPDLKKIIVLIVLFVLFSALQWHSIYGKCDIYQGLTKGSFGFSFILKMSGLVATDVNYCWGLPLPIYGQFSMVVEELATEIFYVNIIINLIFWYLISCIIISAYNRYKK